MHELEPHYGWQQYYNSTQDEKSPFFQKEHNELEYTDAIYGYYIHPQWDHIGSETLYIKILYANYKLGAVVIEFIGEWNDAINNDIMHLKRNIIDELTPLGITKYILIGENVFNFHGSDDCYYEEWFDDVEDGWIAALNFAPHVTSELSRYNIDNYINYGGELDTVNWRALGPAKLFTLIDKQLSYRLN